MARDPNGSRTDDMCIEEHQQLLDPTRVRVAAYAWNFRSGVIEITRRFPIDSTPKQVSVDAKLMQHMELFDSRWAAACRIKEANVQALSAAASASFHLNQLNHSRSLHTQDAKAVEGELACILCADNRRAVMVAPCNHVHVCIACFSKWNTHCASCRAVVDSHVICYM